MIDFELNFKCRIIMNCYKYKKPLSKACSTEQEIKSAMVEKPFILCEFSKYEINGKSRLGKFSF